MPEGDTLARIAIVLREALVGRRVARFVSPIPALRNARLEGRTIASVEARGKNLLVAFDDGRVLHTHLRMSGEWLLHGRRADGTPTFGARPLAAGSAPPRRRGMRAPSRALVLLETDDRAATLFVRPGAGAPPIVRLLSPEALRRDRLLRSLGPDVLAPDFDAPEAARRLRASIHPTIAEALLDQRDVAGIGNEYKSELLFLCGIDPRKPPREVSEAQMLDLLARARELMTKNVARGKSGRFAIAGRQTRFSPGPAQWVYGRGNRPCLRCGALVRSMRQGLDRRVTYYCPRCQS